MKRRIGVLLSLVLLFAAVSVACAYEDLWVLRTRPDNGDGMFTFPGMLGVRPDASDLLDRHDSEAAYFLDWPQITRMVASIIVDGNAYMTDWISAAPPWAYPTGIKSWELRVAGMTQATGFIRLVFDCPYPDVTPPPSVCGMPMGYRLILTDNRGMPDAPSNGAVWEFPVPWVMPSYIVPDLLPMIALSEPTHEAMISEGYALEFQQYMPTNPSTVLVTIDVKPGSGPNSINLDSGGVVAVAAWGEEDFSIDAINPDSVWFAGAKAVRFDLADLDGDGMADLISHFRTQDLQLGPSDTEASLFGITYDGRVVRGTDSIRIVCHGNGTK